MNDYFVLSNEYIDNMTNYDLRRNSRFENYMGVSFSASNQPAFDKIKELFIAAETPCLDLLGIKSFTIEKEFRFLLKRAIEAELVPMVEDRAKLYDRVSEDYEKIGLRAFLVKNGAYTRKYLDKNVIEYRSGRHSPSFEVDYWMPIYAELLNIVNDCIAKDKPVYVAAGRKNFWGNE